MLENDQEQFDKDLKLLTDAAQAAGQLALQYFGKKPNCWTKAGGSPVSEADMAVDTLLKAQLLQARSDYGWISEETVDDRTTANHHRFFVVDPIDGTRGFLAGSDQWCISIAVIEAGRPVVGVLLCPARQEFYSAVIHQGAYLNGQKLQMAAKSGKESILLSSSLKGFEEMLEPLFSVEKVASIPSLAYRLALVANNKLDLVAVRPDCHDWDIAAADLIVAESGGRLCDCQDKKLVYGRAPYCHGFLLAGENNHLTNIFNVVPQRDLG